MGVVRSVPTQQLSPFYLLSTHDVSHVISFTRPSSRLFFSGKGSTAREDSLGTRLVQTDASGRGVGAILSVCRDDDELPVGYFSRKLKPTAAHLIGRTFIVEIDHKALNTSRALVI